MTFVAACLVLCAKSLSPCLTSGVFVSTSNNVRRTETMTSMPTTVQEELLKSERPVEAFPAGMRIE